MLAAQGLVVIELKEPGEPGDFARRKIEPHAKRIRPRGQRLAVLLNVRTIAKVEIQLAAADELIDHFIACRGQCKQCDHQQPVQLPDLHGHAAAGASH